MKGRGRQEFEITLYGCRGWRKSLTSCPTWGSLDLFPGEAPGLRGPTGSFRSPVGGVLTDTPSYGLILFQ